MKKIELELSDKVYSEMKNEIGLKKMSGNLYGVTDGVLLKIIQAVEDEAGEVTITMRENDPKFPDVQS